MAESRVVAVIDALISKASALPGYRLLTSAGLDINYTTVFDGPEVTDTDDAAAGGLLVIGWSGNDAEQLERAASSNWTTGPMAASNHPRDEVTVISCRGIVQKGETVRAARVAVYQIMADVATICRADPSLGINTADTIGGVRTLCFVTAGELMQYQLDGFVAELAFTVTYQARV